MKILLLSKADIQGCINTNILLAALAPKHDVHVFLSDYIFPEEQGNRYADFCRWHDRDILLETIFPVLDALPSFDAPLRSFKALAKHYHTTVQILDHATRNETLLNHVQKYQAQCLLCCRYDYLVRDDLISFMTHGAYNTHSGALPQNGGANSSFRAMHLENVPNACTLHHVTKNIDKGNIVALCPVKIDYNESVFENRRRLYEAGISAFLQRLPELEHAPLTGIPQNTRLQRMYPCPDEGQLRAFIASGKQLVNTKKYRTLIASFLPKTIKVDDILPPCPYSIAL